MFSCSCYICTACSLFLSSLSSSSYICDILCLLFLVVLILYWTETLTSSMIISYTDVLLRISNSNIFYEVSRTIGMNIVKPSFVCFDRLGSVGMVVTCTWLRSQKKRFRFFSFIENLSEFPSKNVVGSQIRVLGCSSFEYWLRDFHCITHLTAFTPSQQSLSSKHQHANKSRPQTRRIEKEVTRRRTASFYDW